MATWFRKHVDAGDIVHGIGLAGQHSVMTCIIFRLQTHVTIDKEQFYVTPNYFCSLASIFHDSTVCKHFLLLNVRRKLVL
jgi:hypothetical protein